MRLCLVTDRRRLGEALRASPREWSDLLLVQSDAAARGGVDLIQVREPDLEAAALALLVRRIVSAVRGSRTRIVVNDRLDVAVVAGAHGVQLRERSFGPADALRVAPGLLCGGSVHAVAGVLGRQGASFFIAGTVLETRSKAHVQGLGWAGLSDIVAAAGTTPVLGIGGLGLGDVPQLVQSGASGLAAIGAFIPTGPDDLADFVQTRVEDLRFAFDSACRVT